jgi:Ribbon-helix-helix domain
MTREMFGLGTQGVHLLHNENTFALAKNELTARIANHALYAGVYTPTYTIKSRKPKAHRSLRRKSVLFGVWLSPEEKRKLQQLASRTGVDQSKLVRRGLQLLFDAFNRGQLELGFPDAIEREPRGDVI